MTTVFPKIFTKNNRATLRIVCHLLPVGICLSVCSSHEVSVA